MAKNKVAKAIYDTPSPMPKRKSASIEKCSNGFVIRGAYDNNKGCEPMFIAKTEAEAKTIASKLL